MNKKKLLVILACASGLGLSACNLGTPNANENAAMRVKQADILAPTTISAPRANISSDWLYLEHAASDANAALALSDWSKVNLPHTWNAFDTTDVETGYRRDASWYRKQLDVNVDTRQRYFLHFEAAQMKAHVYVNGTLAGTHVGGYVSFDIEVSDYLVDGTNDILVKVDNSIDKNLVPSQKADFFQYGGLTRDVWFLTEPENILKQVQVTTPQVSADQALVAIKPILDVEQGFTPAGYSTEITGPDGSTIAETTALELTIEQPALWSPDTPSLYTIKTQMLDANGNIVDTFEDRFGLRWFEFKPHGAFYLNGERLLLRGTHLHEEHAGYGAAMPDTQRIADMQQIKALGANFVRLGHYPQDPVVYDTADELGLIIWDEVPWNRGGVGGEEWRENTQYLTRRMIEQNYNRASIFFWALGNEMYWLPDFEGGGDREKVKTELQALEDITKALDPYRLTGIRKFPEGAEVIDVYSPSIWAGWYGGGYSQYEAAIKKYRQQSPAMLHMEYGGSSHVGRHLEQPFGPYGATGPDRLGTVEEAVNQVGVTSVAKSKVWDETYMVDLFDWHLRYAETDPDFAGSAQWAFKDFGTPIRPENPLPFVNQKGLVDRAGKPKDVYHVFARYWKKDPQCWIESDTWTHRVGKPNETKTLSVFCNTNSAELSLNGKPLGKKTSDINVYPASGLTWDITFQEGVNELSVNGFDTNGDVVATHQIEVNYSTEIAGKMVDIVLTQSAQTDGTVLITAEAQDKHGRRCLSCNERIYFTHDGGGKFNKHLGTPTGSQVRELASGTASIVFTPGDTAATIGIQSQDYRGYYIEVPAK